MMKDNCDVYAAQMAFYFFFALFPCMLFLTTLLAYLPVPNLLQIVLKILGQFTPNSVYSLVEDNIRALFSARQGGLLSIGALLSLWTGSSAMIAIMTALNVAFDIEECRTWWKVRLISVLLVIALSIFVVFSLLLLVFGPQIGVWIASLAGLGNTFTFAWNILRWPVILCLMTSTLSGIYRFAPALVPSWRETVPGAVSATGIWVVISLSFSFYVNNFGTYDKTYGSIGAVIVLLVWMYASGFVILLGGEINARMRDLQYEQETGMKSKGGGHMRKEIISLKTRKSVSDEQEWLDLTVIARVELTSEDPSHPIESALSPTLEPGWMASEPGRQTIRLLFDEAVRIKRINLEFLEVNQPRTQQFELRWSSDAVHSYREIVRQQYTFSPPDTSREIEDFVVDLVGVTSLELSIVPDIGGGEVRASLALMRIS